MIKKVMTGPHKLHPSESTGKTLMLVFTACLPILTIKISKIKRIEDSFTLKIATITNLALVISACKSKI